MTSDDFIEALDLPPSSQVDRRVPKKLLVEHGAPTAADKRQINDGIAELCWLAALKPSNSGVPAYRDEAREYLEIAVLRLALRDGARVSRLIELVHRAIPYPALLITERATEAGLSVAHKRWSMGEAERVVLDSDLVSLVWDPDRDGRHEADFWKALSLNRQPLTSLYSLYQGWLDTLLTQLAARVTGEFVLSVSAELAVTRRDALLECGRLESEIAKLRSAAAKERQMARRVDLNLRTKRAESALAAARARMKSLRSRCES